MGVQPLSAGFKTMQIKPEPGDIKSASLTYLTIRGKVKVRFENDPHAFKMAVQLPQNTTTNICLPFPRRGASVLMDGKPANAIFLDRFWMLEDVTPGYHQFIVR
jgi:hypothetical protein